MFQLQCKAAILLLTTISLSCSFANLRPIGISTVPEAPWSVLPCEDSPVILIFDTLMERQPVENAAQVYSPNGAVETKPRWENWNLHLVPVSPLRPGIRYNLKLSGTVTAMDGRETTLSADIPFFAVSRSPLPYVESFFPPDNGSVGIHGPHGAPGYPLLELRFSHSMDSRSTEDALKFDIPGVKKIEWQDDHRTMLISSSLPLNPWITYKWSVSEKALSGEGAPLTKEYGGRFTTDLDRDFISVVRVLPLIPPNTAAASPLGLWGAWLPAGLSFEPGPGHGIGVEFSKPVDSASLAGAFSFVPSLPGRVELLSPVSAVFIPSKEMECETVYEMRISGAIKDAVGLKMGDDYVTNFKADIPFLKINSVSFAQGEENKNPKSGLSFPVKVFAGGILRCFIRFSLPFEPAVKEETAFKITLRPFFPLTLPPVSLRSAQWINSDWLFLEWEGPAAGENGEAHFYKLTIPGGVHNGKSSHLENDFILYLEAKDE